jgi:hypothetical protein
VLSTTFSAQHNGPAPLAAYLSQPTGLLTVTFDRPLRPGLSATTNWRAHYLSYRYTPIAPLVVAGTTVSGLTTPTLGGPPGPTVTYLATPPDVTDLAGLPAAPFTGYPLTVGP